MDKKQKRDKDGNFNTDKVRRKTVSELQDGDGVGRIKLLSMLTDSVKTSSYANTSLHVDDLLS